MWTASELRINAEMNSSASPWRAGIPAVQIRREKSFHMKMYAATIKKDVLEPRSRSSYYFRQKLLIIMVVTLVSFIPLVGISYFSFQYFKNSWIERTSTELASLADSRQQTIELFIAEQDNLLSGLIDLYPQEFLSDQKNLEGIFQAVNKSGVITDLDVIDQSGAHLSYVGPFSSQLAGVNYSQADWFSEVMRKGKYTSDIYSGFRGVPHIVVAVADPSRSIILRASVNLDLFNSLLASAEVGPGGDAFILNRKGELQTPARLDSAETPFSLEGVSTGSGTTVYRTDDFIYSATSLKDGDWVLVLKENMDSLLSEFNSARNRAALIIILAVAIIATVATLLISSIINRIKVADQQRTALNERMRQVEKMALMGRLAASVSHEINNPLQIIENQAGWIDELLEDEKQGRISDFREYQDAVEKIRSHVKRVKSITHGLLGFSRTDEAELVSTNINSLINETVSFLEDEANNNRITIIRKFHEDLPQITTDQSQLQQVFLNIINNAIDAIGQDGSITVTTSASGSGGIVAEFSDTGPGMRDEDRRKIFDPFFSTKNGENAGLGLSISYNIIRRLGGDIEAKNREQGGSIFKVFLPVGNGSKRT